jgi:hypothetical protein
MTQQTAVEWLKDMLEWNYGDPQMLEITWANLDDLLERAKQMEKEQIVDAHIEGQRVFDKHPHTQWTNDQAEQYYNETYGKTK